MKLYTYFRSSAAFRVRIALNLKGLKPEQVFVHLRKNEQGSAPYRGINPQGLVPTLEHDGRSFGQSLAIAEYLDEIVPEPPLLPARAAERARVRQLADIVACDIHPLGNLRVLRYLRDRMGQNEEAVADWQRHWIALGLEAFEDLVAGSSDTGRFCHKDKPTLADIFLIPQLANARRAQLDLAPFPTLLRIEETALALPAFADALPKNQPDAE
ncbi:MAG: maleylacetoacetate isomerase [Alphaproteobacteria bacterium]|nr:maleylacetoacetate isomerase [Alphaproteobacteria bacterium]